MASGPQTCSSRACQAPQLVAGPQVLGPDVSQHMAEMWPCGSSHPLRRWTGVGSAGLLPIPQGCHPGGLARTASEREGADKAPRRVGAQDPPLHDPMKEGRFCPESVRSGAGGEAGGPGGTSPLPVHGACTAGSCCTLGGGRSVTVLAWAPPGDQGSKAATNSWGLLIQAPCAHQDCWPIAWGPLVPPPYPRPPEPPCSQGNRDEGANLEHKHR